MVHYSCTPIGVRKTKRKATKNWLSGILLHHDNASAHTAHLTMDFLRGTPVQLLTHHPYSPDLAPCDFFLFPTVKARLRGKRFSSPEDMVAAYQGELCALDERDWRQCFQSWLRRMQRCIDVQGEYFDKMQWSDFNYST